MQKTKSTPKLNITLKSIKEETVSHTIIANTDGDYITTEFFAGVDCYSLLVDEGYMITEYFYVKSCWKIIDLYMEEE